MFASRRLQLVMIIAGDLFLFYLALVITLTIRYLEFPTITIWNLHQWPFFFIHIIWLVIFYITGLYELKNFGSRKIIFKNVATTMVFGGILAVLIFYLIPAFKIAPKINLLIDIVFVAFFIFLWRQLFGYLTIKTNKTKVLFFGKTKEAEEIVNHIKKYPQLGYEPTVLISGISNNNTEDEYIKNIDLDHNLDKIIKYYGVQLIVASKNILENQEAARRFYEVLPLGVTVINFPNFYESILGKIPISNITESWFLENLIEINKKVYEIIKRFFDVLFSIILGTLASVFILPVFGAFIKMESSGPIFLRQKRVGKDGKIFEIIKLRSMLALLPDGSAEKNGAIWAGENDKRITKVGHFIRKTRIDELPQLWNILKGDLSFIGPRPERPEFVEKLEGQIPFYQIRHLVKPGVSGWAQINFPYGASIEDAMEKLQYDLCYIKNRSLTLDLSIILRTIATIVKGGGR